MSSLEEARLRGILRQTQRDLQTAEAELTARMTEIREFDAKIEVRLGNLETELEVLDTQIRHYQQQIHQRQQEEMFPNWVNYSKRANPNPTSPPTKHQIWKSTPSEPESELRQLYRELARKYHPDTAFDDLDRQYRHEMMLRINEVYANGDLAELRKYARGMVTLPIGQEKPIPPQFSSSLERVEAELVACQTKLRETRVQIEKLRFHPSVQLSLSVKLGWRQGKDLIGEMAKELERKVAERRKVRDRLMVELNEG